MKFPVAFRLNEGKNILHLKKNGIEKKDSKVKGVYNGMEHLQQREFPQSCGNE